MNSSENPSSDPESKEVLINGVPQDWREAWPISELLLEMGAKGPGVAVERNGEVVRKAKYETTFLFPGDKIEVLRLVGGG